jgi:antitoxin component YwqK of YwqJK toxin-antitoxin module
MLKYLTCLFIFIANIAFAQNTNFSKSLPFNSLMNDLLIDSTHCNCETYNVFNTYLNKQVQGNQCFIEYFKEKKLVMQMLFDSVGSEYDYYEKKQRTNYQIRMMNFQKVNAQYEVPHLYFNELGNVVMNHIWKGDKELRYYSNGETEYIRLTHEDQDTLIIHKYPNGFPHYEIKIKWNGITIMDSLNETYKSRNFNIFNYTNVNNECYKYEYFVIDRGNKNYYCNKFDYNGIYKTWYDNGQKQIVGQYENNFQVGEWLFYNQNGKLIRKMIYDKNGNITKCKPCGNIDDFYFLKFYGNMDTDVWYKINE